MVLSLALLSLISPAFAACEVPSYSYPDLQSAVDAEACMAPETIGFGSDWVRGNEPVEIYQDVYIDAGSAALPPLAIVGATLTLVGGEAWSEVDGDFPYAAIAASEADVVVDGTIFPPNGWFAVDAWASDVTITRVFVEDFVSVGVFRSDGGGSPVRFDLSESSIVRSAGHAVWLADTEGALTNVTFAGNTSEIAGADLKIENHGQTVTLVGIESTDAATTGTGGSIYAVDAHLSVSDSSFLRSTAEIFGGAIYVSGDEHRPEVLFERTSFEETRADLGGAIAIRNADVTMEGVDALHTRSIGNGGFAWIEAGSLRLNGGQVVGADTDADFDKSYGDGGAIWAFDSSVVAEATKFLGAGYTALLGGIVYLDGSDLGGNGAVYDSSGATSKGGAIFAANGSSVDLGRPTFRGTYSNRGGGIYADRSDVGIAGGTVKTTSANMGGFVYQGSGRLTIDSLVAQGPAAESGALVYTASPVMLEITRSWVCSALSFGRSSSAGVVDVVGRPVEPSRIDHSVFYDSYDLGAVVRYTAGAGGSSTLSIVNNDFVANQGMVADVLVDVEGADVTNTIFSRTSASAVHASKPVAGGWSLYDGVGAEISGTGSYANVDPRHGDPLFVDPAFVACVADLNLGEGSPAIDGGDPSMEDGYGGESDIGAFDAEAEPGDTDVVPDDTAPEDTDTNGPGDTDRAPWDGNAWVSGGGCDTAPRGAGISAILLAMSAARRRR